MGEMRGATVEVKCKRCRETFSARVADRKRGWGLFCSKSCKAIRQSYGRDAYRPDKSMAALRARADRNPDSLSSSDLISLGAQEWEVNLKRFEEDMDGASFSGTDSDF